MNPSPLNSPRPLWLSLLALACLAALATAQQSPPPLESRDPVDSPAGLLRRAMEEGSSPGAALLTIEGGEIREEVYLGRFHGELVLPFDGASAWLSTATVLTLVDAGPLDLEDPLVKFFPEVQAAKAGITLRHLLSHTAGLPTSHPCLAQPAESLDSCAREILQAPAVAPPGREFLFGSAGLQLAGRIAEIVTGEPWEEIFRQRLATPLGLEKTSYGRSSNPPLATGARGTVRDYGRFLSALLPPTAGSRPLLSPMLAVEMLTDQAAGTNRSYWPLETAQGYGLGTWLQERDRQPWALSPGALGFTAWLLRDRDFAAISVISAKPAVARDVRENLWPLLLPALRLPK